MKKLYSKPEIMFENFTLSTNIAAGCEVKTNLQAEGGCGYQPPRQNKVIFTNELQGCTTTQADGLYNGICYDTPSENYNLFNS